MLIVCPACQQHALVDSARSDNECGQCGASFKRRTIEAALVGVVAITTAACYGAPPPGVTNHPPAADPTEQPSGAPATPPAPQR